ncbi:MAG: hypothetical protein OEY59_00100 [Deltaproteobacteria bacterium]|nr:hypothetical protein [Deltaproteobacteria bacterium]
MGLLPIKSTNKRVYGAEMIIGGGILFASKFFLGVLAPAVLGIYGLYRLLFKKSYPDGIISIALGVLLYFVLNTFSILLWIPSVMGIMAIIYGAILLFMPRKEDTEPEI